ncbi:CinA family nicotinamide mononucleotide deamidase-related protein [Vibrio zhugei]|uniref:CinA-like protein n=1 Tax=Vibrio zhugei TaxID=2479546 RepID=A0ABV7C485_9VIBR|nr:CinA family nicotinamide mononucleotide deamidase-related protein [Vibrio zhugei]
MLKIAMLSTGEEVLHGDIVDTNAAWLGQECFRHGFALCKRSTVGDAKQALVEELTMLAFNCDVVIVNGGLGPTTDDLSAEAAADAASLPLVLFESWVETMRHYFNSRHKTMPQSNIKQAMLPEGAQIIPNPIGTACGFKMKIHDCWFYFTPGVPSEFKRMVEEQIIPDLHVMYPDQAGQECSYFYTFGSSESGLSDRLDKLQLPQGYSLGYRSYLPFIEVKLFGPKGDNERRLKVAKLIFQHIEPYTVSIDQPMLDHLGQLVASKGLRLSIAEQSTKGWLSHWLMSNPEIESRSGHNWILSHDVEADLGESDGLAPVFALAGATRDKCGTELALVTGPLSEEGQFSIALSAPEGEWGQIFRFTRQYSADDQKMLIGTLLSDMLRRYLSGKPVLTQCGGAEEVKALFIPASELV